MTDDADSLIIDILDAAGEEKREQTAGYAAELAALIRQWQPTLPRGPSSPARHRSIMARPLLRRKPCESDRRTIGPALRNPLGTADRKLYHGRRASLAQGSYAAVGTAPCALVLDDLLTTGKTMRQSLETLRPEQAPSDSP